MLTEQTIISEGNKISDIQKGYVAGAVADYAFQSVLFSNRTLMAGFTSVRDPGGTGVNIALRNAIAGKSVADSARKAGFYPELVTPKALAIGPKMQTMFAKAY